MQELSSSSPGVNVNASKMLENALQQMDGIICHATTTTTTTTNDELTNETAEILKLSAELAKALKQLGLTAAPPPDELTAHTITDWLEKHMPHMAAEERLRRLQHDHENLSVQYQLLADRVNEQADKIIELEGLLTEKTQQLSSKEDMLQRQLLTASALETQKFEFMSAISELKLHRAALGREAVELAMFSGSAGNLQQLVNDNNNNNHNEATTTSIGAKLQAKLQKIQPQFHSLPRIRNNNNNHNNNHNNNNNNNTDCNLLKQRNVAFASVEKIIDATQQQQQQQQTPSPTLRARSARGLRQIFGKLRRSNSGNLEQTEDVEFKRGGARATAAGRIEWSNTANLANNKAWVDWTPQEICNWLADLGLACYEDDCRKWLKNNASVNFFEAAPIDIERELGIKMPLHRKKLMYAMAELTGRETDELALCAAQLDVSWVLRWLDDIGLPQYKDNFLQAKLDGRMLHRLTLEDLVQLHISSCLHIASLRRGIQIMREMRWNPGCLIRRSLKAEEQLEHNSDHETVALWTAHRVMEWLRVVDLSEYAPNLRGAGVHGALMLYETRFNANLLADLLSIPPSKTLLRRHLATHFKELLGREVITAKREAETAAGCQPLSLTAKLKPPKKTQFSLKRRKSTRVQDNAHCVGLNVSANSGAGDVATEFEWTSYVCPMSHKSSC